VEDDDGRSKRFSCKAHSSINCSEKSSEFGGLMLCSPFDRNNRMCGQGAWKTWVVRLVHWRNNKPSLKKRKRGKKRVGEWAAAGRKSSGEKLKRYLRSASYRLWFSEKWNGTSSSRSVSTTFMVIHLSTLLLFLLLADFALLFMVSLLHTKQLSVLSSQFNRYALPKLYLAFFLHTHFLFLSFLIIIIFVLHYYFLCSNCFLF